MHLTGVDRRAEEAAGLAAFMDWQERFLAAVMRHLPALALVLRAVVCHVAATEAQPNCCRGDEPN